MKSDRAYSDALASTRNSFFHGVKNCFHGKKNDFHTLKSYFHDVKITMCSV